MMRRFPVLLGLLLFAHLALAVPPGYRYIGSLVVSGGRHVYWYWNVDFLQADASGTSFVAQLHARNVELNEERSIVVVVRCDTRAYRRADSRDAFDPIQDGDPVFEVWRAGCDGGRAVALPARNARFNGAAIAKAGSPADVNAREPAEKAAAAPRENAPALANAPPPVEATPADERRVDSCVRFIEARASQFGDATITNTCKFAVEVAYCYKGGRGGTFDCPSLPKAKRFESLGPGATHNLEEYRRGSDTGLALVACKGTMSTVTPMLNGDGGKTGCR
jgi:hypothetical protein